MVGIIRVLPVQPRFHSVALHRARGEYSKMNNIHASGNSNKDTYIHEEPEDRMNSGSTPLLHATDLEAPPTSSQSPPSGYIGSTEDHHVPVHDTQEVPVLESNKVFDFTGHVDCTFAKVFPESRGAHNVEAVSRCMNTIFSLTQQITYMILTVFIATFLVIIWGFIFAISNFVIIWFLQPVAKLLFLFARLFGDITRVVIKSAAQPFFQAASAIYSNFRGNFNVNVTAHEPLTTDDLPLHIV